MKNDILDIVNIATMKNRNSKVIILGHSFGGRIVSNMFIEELEVALDENKVNILGDNVLISTVNPAIGYKKFKKINESVIKKNLKPAWINFTSRNDKPTKFGFPIGRFTVLKDSGYVTIGHKKSYQTHELSVKH
jgi:predicted alpha/beta-fold hydrolase